MDQVMALRVDDTFAERLEIFMQRLQAENPGIRVTKSDALRTAAMRGLDSFEAEIGKGKRR